MTAEEMAVNAIGVLDRIGYYVNTSRIKGAMGLDTFQQKQLRDVLNRLVNAGVVELDPSGGKHSWRIAKDMYPMWDPTKPFKKLRGGVDQNVTVDLSEWRQKVVELQSEINTLKFDNDTLQSSTATALQMLQAANAQVKDLEKKVAKAGRHEIVIKHPDGSRIKLKDKIVPEVFPRILDLAMCRMNIMLCGPAGCGKTHTAADVAAALKLDFEAISCTSGMSEAHVTGRNRPKLTGKDLFLNTGFLRMYENGGVFLFDEFDAADPNLLLVVNTALANGYCAVPNRDGKPVAEKHEDFVCMGTANTILRGGDRMYQGRNQLDAATIDRFQMGMVMMDYDLEVEEKIVLKYSAKMNGKGKLLYGEKRKYLPETKEDRKSKTDEVIDILVSKGFDAIETLWFIRDRINRATGLRRLMSTRFIQDACIMMSHADWDIYKILEAYFCGWSAEEVAKMV